MEHEAHIELEKHKIANISDQHVDKMTFQHRQADAAQANSEADREERRQMAAQKSSDAKTSTQSSD